MRERGRKKKLRTGTGVSTVGQNKKMFRACQKIRIQRKHVRTKKF